MRIRRAADRFVTHESDRTTAHSFSFGPFYDPDRVSWGGLVCHNDDKLAPLGGYDDHGHSNLEIVTVVLSGALVHTDSAGHRTVLGPGQASTTSAGAGISHSERAADEPTRFLQAWVLPDEPGGPSRFTVGSWGLGGVGGDGTDDPVAGAGGLPIGRSGATLRAYRPIAGSRLVVPAGRRGHLFLAEGALQVDDREERLTDGDSLLLADEGAELTAAADSTVFVWTFAE